MTYREPLTPVPYARRTEPSKSLADGAEYVPAVSTNIRVRFQQAQQEQTCAQSSQHS